MSSSTRIGYEVSHDEHGWTDEDPDLVDERLELHATVELERQGWIDTEHPESRARGLTLEAEERLEAREWEIERTSLRVDRSQTSDREARTRRVVEQVASERRTDFWRRAASVDPAVDPDRPDPREELSKEELGAVNTEAIRLAPHIDCWSRAALGQALAEHVVEGASLLTASLRVIEETKTSPGVVVPISRIGEVPDREVDIAGTVSVLWEPSNPAIQQVGLVEDESGRTKFTVWKASRAPMVDEDEHVVFRKVAKSWYGGRYSVAVTGWSEVVFPQREAWWNGRP
jgi:hypothetical protein